MMEQRKNNKEKIKNKSKTCMKVPPVPSETSAYYEYVKHFEGRAVQLLLRILIASYRI
jgi:hypothetical protein